MRQSSTAAAIKTLGIFKTRTKKGTCRRTVHFSQRQRLYRANLDERRIELFVNNEWVEVDTTGMDGLLEKFNVK